MIEARTDTDDNEKIVLAPLPMDAYKELSPAIVRYVIRTDESVILDDASNEGLFTGDDYVRERKPKSLLCIPIKHHGKLVSVLYLENNHAIGAFTSDRVDVLRTLTGFLGDDRLSNRREIEKLVLFVGPEQTAKEADVLAAVGDIGATTLDDTVFAAAGGDIGQLDRAIERFWAEGGEPIGLIRATQRHFQRLHRVAGQMESGIRYEEAAKKLRPPVFWKQSGPFQHQARNWSRGQLELALARLGEAELVLKTTGVPSHAACGRTLYAIASMRRSRPT